MTKQLLAFTFALSLLINPALRAEGNHHHERDTIIKIENEHDHCHEKISAGARLAQVARNWVRPTTASALALIAYNSNAHRQFGTSKELHLCMCASFGFTAGHLLKKAIGFGMYLNNVPKK